MVQIQPPAIVRGLSPLSDSLPFFPWCQEAFMFWALGNGGAGANFYAFELTYLHVSSVLFLACLPVVFLEPLFFPGVRVHTDEWCVFTGAQKRSLELWLLLGAWKQSHQQEQRVRTETDCPGASLDTDMALVLSLCSALVFRHSWIHNASVTFTVK